MILGNTGLDEEGSLKEAFMDIEDIDWGEPDEYTTFEKRPSVWRVHAPVSCPN
jgi:hypothetical protein